MMRIFLFLATLCVAVQAYAFSEFNGVVREASPLYNEPNEASGQTGDVVEAKETVFILGSSVGGLWSKVLKRGGETGWMPLRLLDLQRISQLEYDAYFHAFQRQTRRTSRFTFEAGVSRGTVPLGLGAEAWLWFNPLRDGLLDIKEEQFELGVGYSYHLGVNPNAIADKEGNLVSPKSRNFRAIPLVVQWLFRFGERGTFMTGPRFGLAIVNDPFSRFDNTLPMLAGWNIRYFPGEDFGVFVTGQVLLSEANYYSGHFGMTYRY
jgi:hypothetical protein